MTPSGWQPLPKPMVVDSGAGETVLPSGWFRDHRTHVSEDRLGEFYTTADGSRVYNEGEKKLLVATMDGQQRAMTFQVAPVHKALGSVHQVLRKGNKVTFDTDESGRYVSNIAHKASGKRIPLRVEKGVYVLDMLVASPGSSFTGPGQR